MKAIAYTQTGLAADVLKLIDLPTPEPGAGEVRVKLQWSGVNPSDVKSRLGLRSKTLAVPADHAAQRRRRRDRCGGHRRAGVARGRTRVDLERPVAAAVRHRGAVHRAAGGAGGAACPTACRAKPAPASASRRSPRCKACWSARGVAGRRVLVAGGAGAVGHYAVQFARRLGAAQVVATVSSEAKAKVALDAGADATIDYKRDELPARAAALTGGKGVRPHHRGRRGRQHRGRPRDARRGRRSGDLRQRRARHPAAVLPGDREERDPALLHRLQPERGRPRTHAGHAAADAGARRTQARRSPPRCRWPSAPRRISWWKAARRWATWC